MTVVAFLMLKEIKEIEDSSFVALKAKVPWKNWKTC